MQLKFGESSFPPSLTPCLPACLPACLPPPCWGLQNRGGLAKIDSTMYYAPTFIIFPSRENELMAELRETRPAMKELARLRKGGFEKRVAELSRMVWKAECKIKKLQEHRIDSISK